MDHFAQRRQRRWKRALHRFHCRHEAWRNDPMPADLEKQLLEIYSEFLSRADHKARMEKRLFALDNETAMRTARRLGGADVAIAKARIALNGKGSNAKKLLEAVPAESTARCFLPSFARRARSIRRTCRAPMRWA